MELLVFQLNQAQVKEIILLPRLLNKDLLQTVYLLFI